MEETNEKLNKIIKQQEILEEKINLFMELFSSTILEEVDFSNSPIFLLKLKIIFLKMIFPFML
jgi:hypothetical protein